MDITFIPKMKGLEQFEIIYDTHLEKIVVKEYCIGNPNIIFEIKNFEKVD